MSSSSEEIAGVGSLLCQMAGEEGPAIIDSPSSQQEEDSLAVFSGEVGGMGVRGQVIGRGDL